jgi:hypothetical protein
MHARYEAAWTEFEAMELQEQKATRSGQECASYQLQQAQKANLREIDALRLAILYQVPNSGTDALVLCHHIESAFDLIEEGSAHEAERQVVGVALSSLLDFMCRDGGQEPASLGAMFKASADRVRNTTRQRKGEVEQ